MQSGCHLGEFEEIINVCGCGVAVCTKPTNSSAVLMAFHFFTHTQLRHFLFRINFPRGRARNTPGHVDAQRLSGRNFIRIILARDLLQKGQRQGNRKNSSPSGIVNQV